MGPPSEVTGGIFQDLASFAIFFDLRDAAFEHFSPRIEARMHVGVLGLVQQDAPCASLAPWVFPQVSF